MSFAKSFYADQKPVEKPSQETTSPVAASIPVSTPIAEDALTPAQIQEAIRIYRSVLSSSAPASPVRHSAPVAAPERPAVHSNYYGGGPTDIPQSYLLNYATSSPSRAPPAPVAPVAPASPQIGDFTEEQLLARLQSLKIQQAQAAEASASPASAPVEPTYVAPAKAAPKKDPVARRMYDDEESGYCFNRPKNTGGVQEEEVPEAHIVTPVQHEPVHVAPSIPAPIPTNYSKVISGASEYIGMANDNKFIYDAQKALPASYANNAPYTLVNAVPQPHFSRPEEPEEQHGTTTTEDVTQVPASPAVTSRFRGLIKNAQTPVQATAPIVVERVAEQPVNYNNYGAFMPVNQMSMESEYQLPVLNDLASCIEHY